MTDATPATEFRTHRQEGEFVTLPPTGRRVRMKAVKPAELLRLGEIPDVLADLVIKFLYGTLEEGEYEQFFTPDERKEQALQMIESLRIVCTCALLEPSISDNPQPSANEMHIDDLEDIEQRFIFDFAMMGATALARFCREQETALESMADDEDVIDETIEADSGEG